MKILFLSHYFPPEGNAPATRTFEHTRRWANAGHDIKVITCAPNVPHGKVYPNFKNSIYSRSVLGGVHVLRVWTYLAANKGKGRRSLNYVSYLFSSVVAGLFSSKPDLMIATSPQFFCGCAGGILAKLKNIPFILEVRDVWPDSIIAVNAISNQRVLKWMFILEKWLYRSATHIVTVGNGYKKVLVEKGVPPEKISIITNGADLKRFLPAKVAKKGDSKFICSFIGTLGMAAGLEIVIRAAQYLDSIDESDIVFHLVGDGADYENLLKKVSDLNIRRIQFAGLVKKENISDYLEETDVCLIHLIKSDLFKTVIPSKLFEAMASEVPVVIGVQGEAAAIVEAAQCGLSFTPENHLELCDLLIQLNNDPILRASMGEQGRVYLESHFCREQLADQYLEVLHKVCPA
ncbi:glycosyltransferase family 4 protein [Verrucomicrobia bacterium]|nr:glycosyltransferase family 4 protein [bacterium]MDB4641988.1 glycosyltransferase family 4 protein [Verrucomicrobiota bacterium]MDB4663503.1 glycosyltransferase family 4 protein [Verrucomicrobiota bacterium]